MGLHSPASELLALLEPKSRVQMLQHGIEAATKLSYECEGDALEATTDQARAYKLSEARRHRERAGKYRTELERLR
jgi:hypothetical protein